MAPKRILVLCGGKFAFPSLQQLGMENFICAVAIGKGDKNCVTLLDNESQRSGFAFASFPDKQSLSGLRAWIDSVQPDYIFSISFPFLLSEEVLAYGPDRFINFHPGPLPNYRGPMPLFEVLRYREKHTAICVHFMNAEFDEGAIILSEQIAINPGETYGSLAVKLSERLAQVTLNMAQMLQFASVIPSTEQQPHEGRYFENPETEDTFIQWKRMTAAQIVALINACNPWNQGADTILTGKPVKLVSASLSENSHNEQPGKITAISDLALSVACINNEIIDVHIVGGDHGFMTSGEFNNLKSVINQSFT